ncbi:pyridoxamine 5'-phosphate oxidase family protein [Streptomyces sp. WAC05374]|uniref:pyridoxamine 5'-phosphate oxidase family protein n=1 Tax=Streptomyces sp. WAC05374 TaxID=2487420 RepID=UPI001055FE49|nr:pyridoxamine 5'-phosphate oxidase family protein [Streptomyces sp. WAC05374]TDF45401.1 pyridoxamine 5'-phosphate oxidase family protein [Streptomyces sp. WAC05374]TDF55611.1 pyridoxamine 5'-phosphate oxidase family protein [Streptomyces sp. WAC05374]TDF58749.1 pyridoxamine 5'-phosphate oxidase family protein [Streptomyces sp. WAC05374]
MTGPYHHGSLAVQTRVGVRDLADHVGRSIGPGIRPVAAAFLELQPMLVIGAADRDGRVFGSLLTGPPGFVRATGPTSVSVTGGVPEGDPLAGVLGPGGPPAGTPVGTIALDPRTRRRMRLGGTARPTPRGLAVEADRVFSNCPKYLQRRELYAPAPATTPVTVTSGARMTPAQADLVREADTFFIATVAPGQGADASHRGGNPGFVTVTSPTTLSWPDYPGNAMFLTLGNLEADARAGLLFLDWTTGTTLQLTGTARARYAGRDRTVHFTADAVVETRGANPLRWSPPEYSPANPAVPH